MMSFKWKQNRRQAGTRQREGACQVCKKKNSKIFNVDICLRFHFLFICAEKSVFIYRLPYDVVNFEIDLMKDLGVKVSKYLNISSIFISTSIFSYTDVFFCRRIFHNMFRRFRGANFNSDYLVVSLLRFHFSDTASKVSLCKSQQFLSEVYKIQM